MKIIMVVPWFPSLKGHTPESQQAIFEYRQTMKLVEKGNDFRVITLKWRGQPSHEVVDTQVEVYRIKPIFVFPRIRYPIPNFISLSRCIMKHYKYWSPDLIIYSHMIYLTTLPIFWLKNRTNIPSIVTTDVFPGVSWFYGNTVVDYIGYLYSMLIGKRIFRLADIVQLMSSGLSEYTQKLNLDTDKTVTITRGVDTKLFQPRDDQKGLRNELNIKQEDIVVLYVGRLDRVKGVDYLLRAALRVLTNHTTVKFLIVGEGGLRRQYAESVKYYHQDIIFTGWRRDVPELMNIADIFVLPSLSEGAANAVMEASACSLPVIATKVGEIPQIVSPEETGILIEPKDTDGLTEAIERLVNNLSLAKTMGKRGRERIVKGYTWDIICDKLQILYREVTEKYQIVNTL